MIYEGSLRRGLHSILPGLIKLKVDLSNAAFVTDWVNPVNLRKVGYMDYVVKKGRLIEVLPMPIAGLHLMKS